MYRTISYVVITVPSSIRVFGSKAKTVMFLSRFNRTFMACQIYRCQPDRGPSATDCSAEILDLVQKVQASSRIEVTGHDTLDLSYKPQDDQYYKQVVRMTKL